MADEKFSSTQLSEEAANNRLVSGQTARTPDRGLRVAYVCGCVIPGHWFIYTHMYLFQKVSFILILTLCFCFGYFCDFVS